MLAVTRPFIWTGVVLVVLYLSAGTLSDFQINLYAFVLILLTLASAVYTVVVLPELANQRGTMKADTKAWDRVLLPAFFLISLLAIPAVSGLDSGRYEWSNVRQEISYVAIAIYLAATVFQTWAMTVNKHFEGTVRIQTDRDHQVISDGPYTLVRHPGYVAMILAALTMPIMIGSWWGLVPAGAGAMLMVARTTLEDRTLRSELAGYEAYTRSVRYRLLPLNW
jgi:protein-S-isoprenylcysteine O-methyltransferase Ste14